MSVQRVACVAVAVSLALMPVACGDEASEAPPSANTPAEQATEKGGAGRQGESEHGDATADALHLWENAKRDAQADDGGFFGQATED